MVAAVICVKIRLRVIATITVRNEVYGAIPKSMVMHIEDDDTYDCPTINHQVMESMNTAQNQAYAEITKHVALLLRRLKLTNIK